MDHLTSEQAVDLMMQREFAFLTGDAGTGKSWTLALAQRLVNIQVAATTGIAAVNLGVGTIHSLLGFFNEESIKANYVDGKLLRKLNKVADTAEVLAIDEVSMLGGEVLTILIKGVMELNVLRRAKSLRQLKLWLIGDMLQIPPVKATWCFESEYWDKFGEPVKLTKIWRQDNQVMLDALNAMRQGDGKTAAQKLVEGGAQFTQEILTNFVGTTIVAMNSKVDRANAVALMALNTERVKFPTKRWHVTKTAEKDLANLPIELDLKLGAYVMILANDPPDFTYVNGDCGTLEELVNEGRGEFPKAKIKLARNGNIVTIPYITRSFEVVEKPYEQNGKEQDFSGEGRMPYVGDIADVNAPIRRNKRYIAGQVYYMPLRAAYSSTVHKTQGLTLDAIQVDIRDNFMNSPGMIYVACSRARSADKIKIVGSSDLLAARVTVDEKVRRFA